MRSDGREDSTVDSQTQDRGALTAPADAPFVNQRDPARRLGPDGKPAVSRRAPLWQDVPDEKWNDWRWQLSNRVNDLEEIEQILELTDEEREGLSAPDKFRVDITPYFISLIDPKDPADPIRRQVIPLGRELGAFTGMMEDSLAEDRHSPGAGARPPLPRPRPDARHDPVRELLPLLHAPADRRRRRRTSTARTRGPARLHPRTPQVRDVLISGGDGLRWRPSCSSRRSAGLREIPHVEIIRIGSRCRSSCRSGSTTSCARCSRSTTRSG
jgi:lysine 2,3-aminomutase